MTEPKRENPPQAEAAIVERDAGLWRLTLWYRSEEEARRALKLVGEPQEGKTP
jgi:hypothetical protein